VKGYYGEKSTSFRGRALDLTPSKFAPYEFRLHFKPFIFVRKPLLKWFLKSSPASLEN
jgi:hypothetical protein